MSDTARLAEPVTGHCLCGAVTITVTAMRCEVDICHCGMCQRWGGVFYAGVKGEAAEVTGEDAVTVYRSSQWAERAFCGTCGSNLWYRFLPTGNRSFLAGLFDLPKGFGIEQQIFVDEKPDWYDIARESPMLTGPEVIAEAKAHGFSFD
ncbi:GFA family protein [Erythrobacter donghaensis]|uniref:GFA family protein n=1 Tax=Erythrobacter donghaensis TaxID=267135 RepID=UPI001FE741FB|nr:GFA family protein [Erythrobacter donghaensis]